MRDEERGSKRYSCCCSCIVLAAAPRPLVERVCCVYSTGWLAVFDWLCGCTMLCCATLATNGLLKQLIDQIHFQKSRLSWPQWNLFLLLELTWLDDRSALGSALHPSCRLGSSA